VVLEESFERRDDGTANYAKMLKAVESGATDVDAPAWPDPVPSSPRSRQELAGVRARPTQTVARPFCLCQGGGYDLKRKQDEERLQKEHWDVVVVCAVA